MKCPIPNDWDNESWKCYSIQWPDSQVWVGFLNGLLSQYTRGAYWDRKTGVIKYAQGVGWQIFDKNSPLVECSTNVDNALVNLLQLFADFLGCDVVIPDLPDTLTVEWLQMVFGECLSQKCQSMTCCDESEDCEEMAITDLKWVNGVLYMEKCCQWWEVPGGSLNDVTGNGDPDDLPDPDPLPTDYACYKASAFATHFVPWLEAAYTYILSNGLLPNSQLRDGIAALFPQTQLNTIFLDAAINLVKWYPNSVDTMLSDPAFFENFRCAGYTVLDSLPANDVPAMSYSEAETIKSVLHSQLPATYDNHAKAYVYQFLDSIQTAYIQTACVMYQVSEVGTCDGCGGTELSPQSAAITGGWFLTQGFEGNGPQSASGQTYNHVCLADMEEPYNVWGFAFKLVSTNTALSGPISNPCGTDHGPSGGSIPSANVYYIKCEQQVYEALVNAGVLNHDYVWVTDGRYDDDNPASPIDTIGDTFGLYFRGGADVELIGVEASDLRFLCNVNNLGV